MLTKLTKAMVSHARVPETDLDTWLVSGKDSVEFLKRSCEENEEIFLYASGPHFYVHSALVPKTAVQPPDHDDLANAHLQLDDTWSIEQTFDREGGARIYLDPPLSYPGCRTLAGGEKLIFIRDFHGVVEYRPTIEISQKLVHALGLYYIEERNGYCRLNGRGDIENVITVFEDRPADDLQRLCAATMRARELATYMLLSKSALVMKFDFTRFMPERFSGWQGEDVKTVRTPDLYYRHGVMADHASYANGHIILHTHLTEDELIGQWNAENDSGERRYVSFKIIDWKNNRLVETCCGPDHIANFFTESDLPWEVSPSFFRPEILHKYKMDPEKYTITSRSISCRGAWHLKTYDINEAGQVHTYIGYLARLPYDEQLYWKSCNEWPKGPISKRAYQTDILGSFSTEEDPLEDIKRLVHSLDRTPPQWWKPREEALSRKALYPATDSIEEWGNEILALDQLVVEGFLVRGLRSTVNSRGGAFEQDWKSLKLLEVALSGSGLGPEEARTIVDPLRELHGLRTLVKAHASSTGRQREIAAARRAHGSLRMHHQHISWRIRDSLKRIKAVLP